MTQVLGRVRAKRSAANARRTLALRYDEAHATWAEQEAITAAMRDDLDTGPGDEADHATRRAQLDEQAALASAMLSHLDDLKVAIFRCDDGRYGFCDGCQCKIPTERLELFPAATRCVACQSRREHR